MKLARGAAILLAVCAPMGWAQAVIRVNGAQPLQTWEGWGTSLAWFANGAGGWPDAQREKLAADLFDPKTGLGLTYLRYNIGGGDNPQNPKPITKPQNAVPGYQPRPGVWDWSVDGHQRWMLMRARQYGADQVEAISFSPPYWMTISGTSEGAANGGSNLQAKFFGHGAGTFADYLAAVVEHFHDAWGITFRTVDPLNEPAPYWWKADDLKQEGCHFSDAEQDRLIGDMGRALAERHLLTTVSAPDENSIDHAVRELKGYSSDAKAQMTQVNTHSYAGTQRVELRELAAKAGKRLSMSEWGSGGDPMGEKIARQIQADVTEMQVVSWSIWQPEWPAVFQIDWKAKSFSRGPLYGVYGSFTRYIKPGSQMFPTDDALAMAAYDANARTLVVVKQNWTKAPAEVRLALPGFALGRASTVTAHSSRGEELPAVAAEDFKGSVPPQSVMAFVVSDVSRAAEEMPVPLTANAMRSKGKAAAAGVTVRFTGTHATAYGTFGPDEGIAAFSVDGGAETDVDLYAPEKREGLLFSTALLDAKAHTLQARVTGLKHPAATGYGLNVKRVTAAGK